jgi:hypothetical protein
MTMAATAAAIPPLFCFLFFVFAFLFLHVPQFSVLVVKPVHELIDAPNTN